MYRRTGVSIAFFLFLVSCTLPVFPIERGFSLGTFFSPSVQADWDERDYPGYPPAFQTAFGAGLETRYTWNAGPYVDLRGFFDQYQPSNVVGFHLYRGFFSYGASLGTGWSFPAFIAFGEPLGPGLRVDCSAHLAEYEGTELYFFYTEVDIVPSLSFPGDGSAPAALGLEFPVSFPLRRGMSAVSLGLTLTFSFHPCSTSGSLSR